MAGLLILLHACIKEDLSGCGITTLEVHYVNNAMNPDSYLTEVNKLDLFVFDHKGRMIDRIIKEGVRLNSSNPVFRITLPYQSGSFHFVVWGNLNEDYDFLEQEQLTIENARLSLKVNDNQVLRHPAALYHGKLAANLIAGETHKIVLMKNTNKITVAVKGLLPETGWNEDSNLTCRIESTNGNYKFDNSLADNRRIIYIPETLVEETSLISDFVVMRMFPEDNTRLKIVSAAGNEREKVWFDQHLPSLILKNPNLNLDRDDYFYVEIVWDRSSMTATVMINGWIVYEQGGIIG